MTMRFRVSDEQEQLRRAVRAFAAKTLTPEAVRALDECAIPAHRELLPKMAALGFTSLPVPIAYGGLGGSAIDVMLLMEELGRASIAVASILDAAIGAGFEIVKRLATETPKHELFDRLMRGELCFAVADVPAAVAARADGNHFIVDGAAVPLSGPREAQCLIVAARSDAGVALFMLDPKARDIDYHTMEAIGLRAAGGLSEVSFRSVRLPRSALLGVVAEAEGVLEAARDRARINQAAYCIGCAQQVVDEAVRYAGQREQFGQPIAKFQAISHLLVDRQVDVDAARGLLYRAAWASEQPAGGAREVSMAHIACTEALLAATSDAMRVYGGYGLTMEFDIQRHYRDARHFVTEYDAGVSAWERIARSMGLRSMGVR